MEGIIANKIKLVECPRDAMQGWPYQITTDNKVEYLNALLKVGFDTLDFGSFVSKAAIPQMADTHEVIKRLDCSGTHTRLLAIIANRRGAEEASDYEQISFLGFPFSLSPTFQQRNTNSTMEESWLRVLEIQDICVRKNKVLVIYLSMGFGNPYNDPYNETLLYEWSAKMNAIGIKIISLADTVGLATPGQISFALQTLVPQYSNIEFGVHLHARPDNYKEKLQAAIEAGCKRFDGALMGIGGCPMAGDLLVGNMDTEKIVHELNSSGMPVHLDEAQLQYCIQLAAKTFI